MTRTEALEEAIRWARAAGDATTSGAPAMGARAAVAQAWALIAAALPPWDVVDG